jgi:peptidoglycan-associated lipoprotein
MRFNTQSVMRLALVAVAALTDRVADLEQTLTRSNAGYDIRSDAQPVLDAQAAWLRRFPNVSIRIEGNCDERGTREYNLALGSRRSNAVKDYLVSRGVSPSRIMTLSNGKERPINPGTDEESYQQNRNGQTIITSGAY